MAVENLPGGQTESYSVEFHHSRDDGISASPVGGPPPQNASLTRLYAPIEFLTIHWHAIAEGKAPILPSYKSFQGKNNNRLFLRGERIALVYPTLVGHIWIAAGCWIYSIPATEDLDSNFCLSKCPWESTAIAGDQAANMFIPATNFSTCLLNPFSILSPGETLDPDVPLLQTPISA